MLGESGSIDILELYAAVAGTGGIIDTTPVFNPPSPDHAPMHLACIPARVYVCVSGFTSSGDRKAFPSTFRERPRTRLWLLQCEFGIRFTNLLTITDAGACMAVRRQPPSAGYQARKK